MRADAALADGRVEEAHRHYREAARITENGLRADQGAKMPEPTRALLISNAAVLWYKAGEWDRAEQLAGEMLSRGPQTVRGTLRQVLLACWQARSNAGENQYFTPLELRLEGEAITYGLAPVEEVTTRQDTIQSLLWRTSELEAGLPYRLRGLPGPEVRGVSQVYAAAAVPGSYHIVLRVKSPWSQPDLFPGDLRPEARVRGGEPLVHRAIELASFIASGGDDAAKQIKDPLYRIALSRLVRDLAPDGRRITDVRLSGGTTRVVAEFSGRVRTRIVEGIRSAYEEAGFAEIRGELTGMELRPNELQIFIHEESQDRRTTLTAPRNLGFEEKVGPLWGRRVAVVAVIEGKRSVLQEIEPADMLTTADAIGDVPSGTSLAVLSSEDETQEIGVGLKRRDD